MIGNWLDSSAVGVIVLVTGMDGRTDDSKLEDTTVGDTGEVGDSVASEVIVPEVVSDVIEEEGLIRLEVEGLGDTETDSLTDGRISVILESTEKLGSIDEMVDVGEINVVS